MRADKPDEEVVTVYVLVGLPELTPCVARVLLGILVELTTVPVLDGPLEGESDER
jgi:hypothetical protein